MKRSSMLRKITRLLKTWEGSQLDGRTSKELLDLIEKEGMLPPPYYDSFYYDLPECDGMIPEWEPENDEERT